MTLNCTANQVLNLISPPTITWIAPDGGEIPTVVSDNRRMDPQTRELVFSDEDVKVPPPKPKPEAEAVQPLSSTGDYEFTQHPAYISVATTSIHGNTNKPMDTPSVQPTSTAAVQDDQNDDN